MKTTKRMLASRERSIDLGVVSTVCELTMVYKSILARLDEVQFDDAGLIINDVIPQGGLYTSETNLRRPGGLGNCKRPGEQSMR
jgi:hypothetical protein